MKSETWTKEVPTENGVYWMTIPESKALCVYINDKKVHSFGHMNTFFLRYAPSDVQWQGPIKPK